MAHVWLRHEKPGHTLNTTGLVHEVYLKWIDADRIQARDRRHFFALAARCMRRILIDSARIRKAGKRGGGVAPLSLEEALWMPVKQAERLIELDETLKHLAVRCPPTCSVIVILQVTPTNKSLTYSAYLNPPFSETWFRQDLAGRLFS